MVNSRRGSSLLDIDDLVNQINIGVLSINETLYRIENAIATNNYIQEIKI